jgi:hypothetical protein
MPAVAVANVKRPTVPSGHLPRNCSPVYSRAAAQVFFHGGTKA